jgi:hypothetical protein
MTVVIGPIGLFEVPSDCDALYGQVPMRDLHQCTSVVVFQVEFHVHLAAEAKAGKASM